MKSRPQSGRISPERGAASRATNVPEARLTIGEPFNPSREACGFYPPDVVARQTDLTDGQKRLYERAVRWAGQNGKIWYSFETMATELGKSTRQVKRDMVVLERRGLLTHTRRGKSMSNLYRFLYHPVFKGEVTSTAHHSAGEVADVESEVTSMTPSEVTPASHEFRKENFVKESSATAKGSGMVPSSQAGDDTSSSKKIGESNVALEQQVAVDLTAVALACYQGAAEDPLIGNRPLPRQYLLAVAKFLQESKCASMLNALRGADVEACLQSHPPPDLRFTVKIVEPWRGKGTFALLDWIWSTVERRLGDKVTATGVFVYGLYRRDSAAMAQGWRPGKVMSKAAERLITSSQRRSCSVSSEGSEPIEHEDQQTHTPCQICGDKGYQLRSEEKVLRDRSVTVLFALRCQHGCGRDLGPNELTRIEKATAAEHRMMAQVTYEREKLKPECTICADVGVVDPGTPALVKRCDCHASSNVTDEMLAGFNALRRVAEVPKPAMGLSAITQMDVERALAQHRESPG